MCFIFALNRDTVAAHSTDHPTLAFEFEFAHDP